VRVGWGGAGRGGAGRGRQDRGRPLGCLGPWPALLPAPHSCRSLLGARVEACTTMCWTVRFFQTLLVLLSPRSSAMDRSSILGGSCAAGATKAHLACLRSERFYDGGGWLWGCPSTCGSAHTLPLLLLNPRFSSPCPPRAPQTPLKLPCCIFSNPPLLYHLKPPLQTTACVS
jgi:hypothetical protein